MTTAESLRTLFIFQGLSDPVYTSVCTRLLQNAKDKFLEKGEILNAPGDYCAHMIIILQGAVKSLYYSETGEEISSNYFEEQGVRILLCIPCLSQVPLRSYYVASKRSHLLLIPRHDLLLAMDENPVFKDRILMYLCSISDRRLSHLYIIQHKRAAHRICSYLLEEYQLQGTLEIKNFPSFDALANFLNLTRPAFSRELHAIERMGAITIDGKCITIQDLDALRTILETKKLE